MKIISPKILSRLVLPAALSGALLISGCATAPAEPLAMQVGADEPMQAPTAAMPPAVGDVAPDFELTELKGQPTKLSALAAKGPVVLVQLRGYPGYQCPICTAQVGDLLRKASQFSQANANVVLIYPGPSEGLEARADEFVRGKDYPANFHLMLDPDYAVANLYGLRWDTKGETAYPATFVLDQERAVTFAKVSKSHGDRAKSGDVIAALPK